MNIALYQSVSCLKNSGHAPVLHTTHPVAHPHCDVIAVLLEGLSGTSWLYRMVAAFPAIISVLLPLALQLFFVSTVRSYLVIFLS